MAAPDKHQKKLRPKRDSTNHASIDSKQTNRCLEPNRGLEANRRPSAINKTVMFNRFLGNMNKQTVEGQRLSTIHELPISQFAPNRPNLVSIINTRQLSESPVYVFCTRTMFHHPCCPERLKGKQKNRLRLAIAVRKLRLRVNYCCWTRFSRQAIDTPRPFPTRIPAAFLEPFSCRPMISRLKHYFRNSNAKKISAVVSLRTNSPRQHVEICIDNDMVNAKDAKDAKKTTKFSPRIQAAINEGWAVVTCLFVRIRNVPIVPNLTPEDAWIPQRVVGWKDGASMRFLVYYENFRRSHGRLRVLHCHNDTCDAIDIFVTTNSSNIEPSTKRHQPDPDVERKTHAKCCVSTPFAPMRFVSTCDMLSDRVVRPSSL